MTDVIVWPGWVGGIAVGLYALAQLLVSGQQLSVSSGFGSICGACLRLPFFRHEKFLERGTSSWRLWFLVGLPLGGLIAALTSPGALTASFSLGPMYDAVLPSAVWAKGLVLIVGGVLMGVGARMAGGCTSGHAIAGMSLLNWPSIVAAAGFFVGGIAAVQVLFRVFG